MDFAPMARHFGRAPRPGLPSILWRLNAAFLGMTQVEMFLIGTVRGANYHQAPREKPIRCECDYVYLRPPEGVNPEDWWVLVYERPEINKGEGTNVLFADGKVQWVIRDGPEVDIAEAHSGKACIRVSADHDRVQRVRMWVVLAFLRRHDAVHNCQIAPLSFRVQYALRVGVEQDAVQVGH